MATKVKTGQQNENYTTAEQVVGTWIAGEPIYRKAAQQTSIANLISNLQTGGSHVTVIKVQIMVKNTADNGWRNIPWLFNAGAATDWQAGVTLGSTGVLSIQAGTSIGAVSQALGVIEYTKT